MKRILAATDFSTRAHRAVRRAGLLAQQSGAELTLLHIVDKEPEHLVALEAEESRKILDEQIASMAELRGVKARRVVGAGAAHDAIMKEADAGAAELIVMGSHRKRLLRDVFVGTTIERVIRTGTRPVLMVNTEAAQPYENVLAALDLSEASAEAVRCAHTLGLLDATRRTATYAIHAPAKSKMSLGDVPKDRIKAYVEIERQQSTAELQRFMTSLSLDPGAWSFHVSEGDAMQVISDAVGAIDPDLLVVGTHGRSGVAKMLLGSVAEQVLRELEIDILAVPKGAAPD